VLIDPPFEAQDDHARIVAAIATARARFPGGIVAAWYPIKHRAPTHALHLDIRAAGIARVIAAELWLRAPLDPTRLNGCGLLIAAPPWQFEATAEAILAALSARLAGEEGAGHALLRITAE
jgi:23S rRNA (adenine2030-N6)-methyltransferase